MVSVNNTVVAMPHEEGQTPSQSPSIHEDCHHARSLKKPTSILGRLEAGTCHGSSGTT